MRRNDKCKLDWFLYNNVNGAPLKRHASGLTWGNVKKGYGVVCLDASSWPLGRNGQRSPLWNAYTGWAMDVRLCRSRAANERKQARANPWAGKQRERQNRHWFIWLFRANKRMKAQIDLISQVGLKCTFRNINSLAFVPTLSGSTTWQPFSCYFYRIWVESKFEAVLPRMRSCWCLWPLCVRRPWKWLTPSPNVGVAL